MNITISGHTIPVDDQDHAERLFARAEEFRAQDDGDGLEKWLYAGAPIALTAEQIEEAKEVGASWGKQEAELQIEAVGNGHKSNVAEWTSGEWCGAFPTGVDRDEYETVLDRAAQAAYEAAAEAAKPKAAPMIAAIEAGIAAGGDPSYWEGPEFQMARNLTRDAGMQWDFDGWKHAMRSLEGGKLGGVAVAQ